MPKIDAGENIRSKKKFKMFKRKVYHQTWKSILAPIKKAQKEKGFMAEHDGRYV